MEGEGERPVTLHELLEVEEVRAGGEQEVANLLGHRQVGSRVEILK